MFDTITRRKLLSAALAAGFLTLGTAAHAEQKPYVPLISKGFQHQFWQAVKQGADKAAADLGVRVSFEGPEGEAQVDKQLDMLSAALAKKPQAIAIAAVDSKAAVAQLRRASKAGIPVIAFDSGVDSDIPLTTAQTDSKAAAALAADKLAALIGEVGEVAVVGHDQTSSTGVDRRDGFVNRIAAKYPQIRIVSVQYGGGDHLKSAEVAKTMLQAHPRLKAIFGTNEGAAIGVAKGVKESGRKVVVVGFDSGKAQKDAIRDGTIAGAITQNPVGIGYETVKAAVSAIRGEKLPPVIDTGFYWYDKSNIDDPAIAAVLYD